MGFVAAKAGGQGVVFCTHQVPSREGGEGGGLGVEGRNGKIKGKGTLKTQQ